jgi:hypothetical protein
MHRAVQHGATRSLPCISLSINLYFLQAYNLNSFSFKKTKLHYRKIIKINAMPKQLYCTSSPSATSRCAYSWRKRIRQISDTLSEWPSTNYNSCIHQMHTIRIRNAICCSIAPLFIELYSISEWPFTQRKICVYQTNTSCNNQQRFKKNGSSSSMNTRYVLTRVLNNHTEQLPNDHTAMTQSPPQNERSGCTTRNVISRRRNKYTDIPPR